MKVVPMKNKTNNESSPYKNQINIESISYKKDKTNNVSSPYKTIKLILKVVPITFEQYF